jgi:hypothetical protein
MKISGFDIDTDAIGAGLYRLICERGDSGLVESGEIPGYALKDIKELLAVKIVGESFALEVNPFINHDEVNRVADEIAKEIAKGIYKAAGKPLH